MAQQVRGANQCMPAVQPGRRQIDADWARPCAQYESMETVSNFVEHAK